jgi:hypothetical protein
MLRRGRRAAHLSRACGSAASRLYPQESVCPPDAEPAGFSIQRLAGCIQRLVGCVTRLVGSIQRPAGRGSRPVARSNGSPEVSNGPPDGEAGCFLDPTPRRTHSTARWKYPMSRRTGKSAGFSIQRLAGCVQRHVGCVTRLFGSIQRPAGWRNRPFSRFNGSPEAANGPLDGEVGQFPGRLRPRSGPGLAGEATARGRDQPGISGSTSSASSVRDSCHPR